MGPHPGDQPEVIEQKLKALTNRYNTAVENLTPQWYNPSYSVGGTPAQPQAAAHGGTNLQAISDQDLQALAQNPASLTPEQREAAAQEWDRRFGGQ